MSDWLDLFNDDFSEREWPLQDRPLHALIELCRAGAFDLRIGDTLLDLSNPYEHVDTDWFRALFAAVEHWYTERFGPTAVKGNGGGRIEGAILIRGVAFALNMEATRGMVETEGETAWLYFEDGLGKDEDPVKWIVDAPDLEQAVPAAKEEIARSARDVATMLRFIRFHSGMADLGKDKEARKLCEASVNYLQQASRRIVSGKIGERGPAWFDLQMANEAALKTVIRRDTGRQPHKHSLSELLAEAAKYGVEVEADILDGWPDFKAISDWRYGQGEPGRLDTLYAAYLTALRLVRACMNAIPPIVSPGFRMLIRYAPWKFRPDGVPRLPRAPLS